MDVTRPATPDDLDAVHALACGMDGRAGTAPDEAFRARYERILGRDDWLLLVAGAHGYALAQDYGPGLRRGFSTGRMHDLYVDPAARRRGLGRALVEGVSAWCRGRPYPMVLDWQSRRDAVPFYDSLGLVGDTVGDTAEYPAYCLDFRQDTVAPGPVRPDPR